MSTDSLDRKELIAKLLRINLSRNRDCVDPSDNVVFDLLEAAAYSGNQQLFNKAENLLNFVAIPQLIKQDPFFPYPKASDVYGELKVGRVLPTMDRFGLTKGQANRNVLEIGAHATGKTTLINDLVAGLYSSGIPFLVPEVAKRKFRNLIRRFSDIQVIRFQEYSLNSLKKPKNTMPLTWLGDFIDAYCYQMGVMLRSKSVMVDAADKAYRMFGIYENAIDFPTLEDISLILTGGMNKPGFKMDDFILRNVQRISMLTTLSARRMEVSSGFLIEKILDWPVIIEMGDQNDDIKNFVTIMLFTYILRHRISDGICGGLKHVLIFDECKRIFDANLEKNFQMGIPPLDFLVSYAREYGEGLILADQEATKLTNSIKANSNCKISFNVSGKEIDEVSRMLGLNPQQKEVFMQLPTGTAVVKMDERHTSPFLIQVDHFPIKDVVSDDEVEEHSRKFIDYLRKDVRPRSTILLDKAREDRQRAISKEAEAWLVHMARNPCMSIVERTASLKITNYIANKVTKELEIKGYAKKLRAFTGRPGHPLILMDFTQRGLDFLSSKGEKVRQKGKAGLIHQFWQARAKAYWQERGKKAVIEPDIEGANTDVLLIDKDGTRTALEIALSPDNQVNNIRRDLEFFDRVVVAAETRLLAMRIRAEAQKALSKEALEKVSFQLLGEFLP